MRPLPKRARTGAGTTAALAALLVAVTGLSSAPVQALGRLFLTPKERIMLEKRRHAEQQQPQPLVMTPPEPVEPEPEAAPPPEVPSITVNGVVQRSDGESTAWVNGMNTQTGDLSSQSITVEPKGIEGEKVRIKTPKHLPDVELKPGQTYQPTIGDIVDVYGPKAQTPKRP